ncbi:M20 family metallopeptidase [Ignatzschineria rhizosphaerae]|uniref:M20 family metallopeptidase n=1 Tax=Ignatzschineria rhizosphaerae TaxID=2923279 RepID=A0ABY3X3X1_9GAMM|nr:M20 aminoacylase family protein [Ignatzschineria rhizosphaerae]UNM96152.1 M20 family metallopeptidase [Ignatzschineria rhizosphaerae]
MLSKILKTPNSSLVQFLQAHDEKFRKLRQTIHANPELSRQEFETADLIESLLKSWKIKTERLSTTGVIGILQKGDFQNGKRIGLRADTDALPIEEKGNLPYRSKNEGVMHACGHDGHTTMLLAAAKYLAEEADFDGTIIFIFQPDEEDQAGARRMVEDGLFEKFPVDAVYGIHNFPGASAGKILIKKGPQMAGTCEVHIDVFSKGGHAAHPYQTVDSVLVAAEIVVGLQSIISRNISGIDSAVLTIGAIHGGHANNVIPNKVSLLGTLRYFDLKVRDLIKTRIETLAKGICLAHGATCEVRLIDGYIPTINHDKETDIAIEALSSLMQPDFITQDKVASMGAEDFGFMLHECPGAYFYIGNDKDEIFTGLHTDQYDFNDNNILIGGAAWVTLALHFLGK